MKKDLKVVFGNKMIWLPMLILPVLFSVIIPGVFFFLASLPDITADTQDFSSFMGENTRDMNSSQMFIYFSVNLLMPGFFLLIPIMASSVIAGSSFVGEKEHKTIETLLYTPIKIRDLFFAKIAGSFIPAYGVTLISFIMFSLVTIIAQGFYFDNWIFPNWTWLVLMLWVVPAVSILSIIIMIITSAKSKSFQEAQQKIVLIVLPVILFTAGQTTGLFILGPVILLILGLAVFLLNYLLLTAASNSFVPEKLIK